MCRIAPLSRGGWGPTIIAVPILAAASVLLPPTFYAEADGYDQVSELRVPSVVPSGVPFSAEVRINMATGISILSRLRYRVRDASNQGELVGAGIREVGPYALYRQEPLKIPDLVLSTFGTHELEFRLENHPPQRKRVFVIPGWFTILPPICAILLALWSRKILVALGAGGLVGALIVERWNPFGATMLFVDRYLVGGLSQSSHAASLLAVLVLGACVGVVTRSGGGVAMARWFGARETQTPRRSLVATWVLGMVVFIDDYASSLFVGTSMRPITDRFRVSREKLAFIVDATSAPVASLALLSSWAALEVGCIADAYGNVGLEVNPYSVLIESLAYRFYPLLMVFFVGLLVLSRRDFGPMWKAERRAAVEYRLVEDETLSTTDFTDEPPERRLRRFDWLNAALPVLTLVVATAWGTYYDGTRALEEKRSEALAAQEQARAVVMQAEQRGDAEDVAWSLGRVFEVQARLYSLQPSLRSAFRHADSPRVLLWASALGLFVALITARVRRSLSTAQAQLAAVHGFRSMLPAAGILLLAWSLSEACRELQTAAFLVHWFGRGVSSLSLPALVFVVSALVSTTTGSAWGAMAVLFPIVIPLGFEVGGGSQDFLVACVGALLAGSVLGDHCSPISDTTIISSIACSCDHRAHVRTQIPYALLVGAVSLVFGEIGTSLGIYPWWIGLLVGALALTAIMFLFGQTTVRLGRRLGATRQPARFLP